jgi:hypothetical protein
VAGNYIGTDVTGTRALGNGDDGVHDYGGNTTLGGAAVGAGNVISANGRDGVDLDSGAWHTLVQGNLIGTDVTGAAPLGNAGNGVLIHSASANRVGGAAAGAGNLISGNGADGVFLTDGDTRENVVAGNFIGTDATGTAPLGNGGNGVQLNSASDNTIGGTAAGAGNLIAFNGGDGVLVDTGTGNATRRNSLFANGNRGIELVHGGNHDQEFPELSSATSAGGVTTVTGALHSAPDTTFTVELFANAACDSSGFGEGERFLASFTVTTGGDGVASFTVSFAIGVPAGEFLTATATDPDQNTSAFSACAQVAEPSPPGLPGVDARGTAGQGVALPGAADPLRRVDGSDLRVSALAGGTACASAQGARPAGKALPPGGGVDLLFEALSQGCQGES